MIPAKTYFIVDDDIDDQQFLIEALIENEPSCRCFTVSNGQEAVANLIEAIIPPPDVIFLDLNMPLMNGRECLAALKQVPSLQHIPVVIYSTTSNKKEIKEIIALGASYFLMKTPSFKELREEVYRITLKLKNDLDME